MNCAGGVPPRQLPWPAPALEPQPVVVAVIGVAVADVVVDVGDVVADVDVVAVVVVCLYSMTSMNCYDDRVASRSHDHVAVYCSYASSAAAPS